MRKTNEKNCGRSVKALLLTYVIIWASGQMVIAQSVASTCTKKGCIHSEVKKIDAEVLPVKQPGSATSEEAIKGSIPKLMIVAIPMNEKSVSANSSEEITNQAVYTFTGKGSWFNASNWENSNMPPSILKAGDHVVINGIGPCVYGKNLLFTIARGSSLEVNAGKELFISIGNNFYVNGGTLTNNGSLSVLSGMLASHDNAQKDIVNKGNINNSMLSNSAGTESNSYSRSSSLQSVSGKEQLKLTETKIKTVVPVSGNSTK